MEFDVAAETVKVRTFSPYCETTGQCPAYKTDPDNEFELTGVKLGTATTAAHSHGQRPPGVLRWWL
jgi:hypothetical protein